MQGKPYAWCATAVDANGVMLPNSYGNCDDERNTAYDGPGKLLMLPNSYGNCDDERNTAYDGPG